MALRTDQTSSTPTSGNHAADHVATNSKVNQLDDAIKGGLLGQYLRKTSDTDYDTEWAEIAAGVSSGVIPVFNVQDDAYGAVGDDSTDDGPAIRAAQLAAHTAGGGIVYLPKPTSAYKIVASAVSGVSNFECGLLSYSNVTLLGEDEVTTIIKIYGTAGRVDGINIGYTSYGASTTGTLTNSRVLNLTIDGGGIPGTSYGSAVRQNTNVDFHHLEYDHVTVKNWDVLGGIGIGMTGGSDSYDVKVTNIHGDNVRRAVVWFATVDYLYIDNIWGINLTGDTGTDEGGVVQVESGRHPIIKNVTGIDTPCQTLLLGGATRGLVSGVRGTFNRDGIYLKGSDWKISDVRLEVGTSPEAGNAAIRYDKTNTPGQVHASPVESTNYYCEFSDIWAAGCDYGFYFNASATHPCNNFQFDRVHFEAVSDSGSGTAAIKLVYCNDFVFTQLQTHSCWSVFDIDHSTVEVIGGTADEPEVAYLRSVTNSTLRLFKVAGQTDSAHTYVDSDTGYGQGGENVLVTDGAYHNTLVGLNAGKNMPEDGTAEANTALGYEALTFVEGDANTGLGYRAAIGTTTGASNTAVGYEAMHSNETGSNNIAVGREAAYSSTVSNNVGVGFQAIRSTSSGGNNVGVGNTAGYNNTTGANNTAVGHAAGAGSGAYAVDGLTLVGREAGKVVETGSDGTTAVGDQAGYRVTTGAKNTLMGQLAGQNLTTGSKNVAVGYNALLPSITDDGQMNLSNAIFGTGLATDTSATTIPALTGKVGIFNTAPTVELDITGTVKATGAAINGTLTMGDGNNIVAGSTTGTKIGTATTQKLGFFNATPVVQPGSYTTSNVTTDRTYDANATSIDELADVVGTLIADLKSLGIIG